MKSENVTKRIEKNIQSTSLQMLLIAIKEEERNLIEDGESSTNDVTTATTFITTTQVITSDFPLDLVYD